MDFIPAIDLIDGRTVRLTKGDYASKKQYDQKPLDLAFQFEEAGIKRLHMVDLDGARLGRIRNWKVLEQVAGRTSLQIDFSGGIQSEKDVEIVLNSGAVWAAVGTIAVKNQNEFSAWLKKFGVGKFILGADVKEQKIAIHGWTETSDLSVFDFLKSWLDQGITTAFCTDVARDGMLEGPAKNLYQKIIEKFPGLDLIASGGIRSVKDLEELKTIGCAGAIVGKAIYEGKIAFEEIKTWVLNYAD